MRPVSRTLFTTFALAFLMAGTISAIAADDADTSLGGLARVESSCVQIAYINPDADFSVFKRVAILEP